MFISRKELKVLTSKIHFLEEDVKELAERVYTLYQVGLGAEQRIKYLEEYLNIKLVRNPARTLYKSNLEKE
jgi:hypothetical protein